MNKREKTRNIRRPRQVTLLRYSKSACGVDFLLNTADNTYRRCWFDTAECYKTDFFEFYFFHEANGHVLISDKRVDLHDGMLLVISPFQVQEWHVDIDRLRFTFLIFQEEFVNRFIVDKYFMYRQFYCYQHDLPTWFDMTSSEMSPFLALLCNMETDLRSPISDSYHMIVAHLYLFLLRLNRVYAEHFGLPMTLCRSNHAFRYKQLLERCIVDKVCVDDYASEMNISRQRLDRAVKREFGVSASYLLKRRLLQEIKDELLFSSMSIKEIAFRLHFSEPVHMMRFFKQQTGVTIGDFLAGIAHDGR